MFAARIREYFVTAIRKIVIELQGWQSISLLEKISK